MERTVDFTAIARVAKRSELRSVRLIGMSAECVASVTGTLVPSVELECKPGAINGDTLEVVCEYTFTAHSNNVQAVSSTIKYLLVYEISGTEAPNEKDVLEFAKANGTLNSWPFAREVLFGLTSRMGYPPYTLPLMHFNSAPKPKKQSGAADEQKSE